MPQRKTIAVYSGQNVSTGTIIPRLRESFAGATIQKTEAKDVINGKSLGRDTLAFILPGIIGDDSPYSAELGIVGNAAIRRYVEEGGVFVGICAGAYYACSDILYDPPWRTAPKTSRPGLNFFNALARGPIPGYAMKGGEYWYSDCRVTAVSWDGRTAGIAYGNGPALYPHDDENDVEILARYDDMPGNPAAIAVKKIGKGLAIFVGVLPYIGYDPQYDIAALPALKDLMDDLMPHEQSRKELWNLIVTRIKQHNADLGRVKLLPKTELI